MFFKLLKFGWRNIWRNRRRTLFTIIAIAFGVFSVIFARSFTNGIVGSTTENIVNLQCGHVKIAHEEFVRLERIMPKEQLIRSYPELVKAASAIPGVEFISPRVKFSVLLSRKDVNETGVAEGIDPEALDRQINLSKHIAEGRYFGKNPGKELVIGKKLAEKLGLKVNDELVLVTTDINYSSYALPFKVVGIFDTGFSLLDKHILYIPIDKAREMLDCGETAHELLIFLKDPETAKDIAAQLSRITEPSEPGDKMRYMTWHENPFISTMLPFMESAWGSIVLIIVIIAALVILNTMLMAVMERFHEVGVLKAMGFKKIEVFFMIMTEAFFIGVIGSAVGGLLGGTLSLITEKTGINLAKMSGNILDKIDIPIPMFSTYLYPDFTLGILLTGLLFGIVSALAASLYPSFKAARMLPVEAFRSQLKV